MNSSYQSSQASSASSSSLDIADVFREEGGPLEMDRGRAGCCQRASNYLSSVFFSDAAKRTATSFWNAIRAGACGAVKVLACHGALGLGSMSLARYGIDSLHEAGYVSATAIRQVFQPLVFVAEGACGFRSGQLIWYRVTGRNSALGANATGAACAVISSALPYFFIERLAAAHSPEEQQEVLAALYLLDATRVGAQLLRDVGNIAFNGVFGRPALVDEDGKSFVDTDKLMKKYQIPALAMASIPYAGGGVLHQYIMKPALTVALGEYAGPWLSSVGLEIGDEFFQTLGYAARGSYKGWGVDYAKGEGWEKFKANVRNMSWQEAFDHGALRVFGNTGPAVLSMLGYTVAAGVLMLPAEFRGHFASHGARLEATLAFAQKRIEKLNKRVAKLEKAIQSDDPAVVTNQGQQFAQAREGLVHAKELRRLVFDKALQDMHAILDNAVDLEHDLRSGGVQLDHSKSLRQIHKLVGLIRTAAAKEEAAEKALFGACVELTGSSDIEKAAHAALRDRSTVSYRFNTNPSDQVNAMFVDAGLDAARSPAMFYPEENKGMGVPVAPVSTAAPPYLTLREAEERFVRLDQAILLLDMARSSLSGPLPPPGSEEHKGHTPVNPVPPSTPPGVVIRQTPSASSSSTAGAGPLTRQQPAIIHALRSKPPVKEAPPLPPPDDPNA